MIRKILSNSFFNMLLIDFKFLKLSQRHIYYETSLEVPRTEMSVNNLKALKMLSECWLKN